MAGSLFDLSGRKALVTGGNSGLGLAYARGMARQGADVVIWGRNAQKNAAAKAELERFGGKVHTQLVDVSDEAAVIAGFAEALDWAGRMDCVVQNAGFNNPVPSIAQMPTSAWRAQLDVALDGGFYTVREAARHMMSRAEAGERGGSIVMCGSGAVHQGIPGVGHYAAAKAGMAAVMKCLAVELAPHGIRVNMIAPGYIRTGLEVAPGLEEMLAERTPIGRVGNPEDLEGAIAYIMSDAARHHTGDILNIDGGWLASYM